MLYVFGIFDKTIFIFLLLNHTFAGKGEIHFIINCFVYRYVGTGKNFYILD